MTDLVCSNLSPSPHWPVSFRSLLSAQGHHCRNSPAFSPAASISLSLLDNSMSTQTWCNLSHLKKKNKNKKPLNHPGSPASSFSTSLNSKITLKNCWHLLSPMTPLFLLNPFYDAKSDGQFFIFCSIWQTIISSSSKHFLYLASRILLSVLCLPHCSSFSLLLVPVYLTSVLVWSSLTTYSGLCLY